MAASPRSDDHDDDNASDDMDLSDGGSPTIAEAVIPVTGEKRKFGEEEAELARDGQNNDEVAQKRQKLSDVEAPAVADPVVVKDPSEHVPGPIWQRVFTFGTPASLFRCLRVCRKFKSLLDNTRAGPPRKSRLAVQTVDSESIWIHVRRTTYTSIPRPLQGLNEAQMLRLITGQTCQNCHKKFPIVKTKDLLEQGPGVHGIRPIWQFKISVCGPCLQQLTLTDVELLSERNELPPGAVRRGLAFVFLSPTLNVVGETVARHYASMAIKKVFSRQDLRNVISEYADAKQLGAGAAEEWVKGLDELGKSAMADALRWTRWEDSLSIGTNLSTYLRELDAASFQPVQKITEDLNADHFGSLGLPAAPAHLPRPVQAASFQNGDAYHHNGIDTNKNAANRQYRLPQDIPELTRARKAEVERRCMLLMPPLEHEILQYMPSYHAALRIAQPMDDNAWNFLQPRLEQERETAERQHYERTQQMALLRAAMPLNMRHSASQALHEAKETERQWEDSQAPLRKKLIEYADDILNSKWLRAEELDADSVPLFAAEVLIYVYDRFTSDLETGPVINGEDPFLSLDAMKYVFDAKIRPVAEVHCREMFVCSACYEEGETKWFAFEGLIQHFGAKHTSDYSKGNVVVHWPTAEWTNDMPFLKEVLPLLKLNQYARFRDHGPRYRKQPHYGQKPHNLTSFEGPAPVHLPEKKINEDLTSLCERAMDYWNALDDVKQLQNSTRVHVVLHHIGPIYEKEFGRLFTLDKLTKMFATDDIMADMKSSGGLACGLCFPETKTRSHGLYFERLGQKKLYILSSLLNHWKLSHLPQMDEPVHWPWNQCIDLPEENMIRNLITAPGMNDAKLKLLADTYVVYFDWPLPVIGEVKDVTDDHGLAARLVNRMIKAPGPKSKKKKGGNAATAQSRVTDQDEYDPQQPLITAKEKNATMELSKFESDADRVAPLTAQLSPTMRAGAQSVAPDLMAALRTFGTGQQTASQPAAAQYTTAPQVVQNQPSAPAALDISAILASLQGAGQSNPSAQAERGRGQQPQQPKINQTNGSSGQTDRHDYLASPRLEHRRTSSIQNGAIAATQPVPINRTPPKQQPQRYSAQNHQQEPMQNMQQAYNQYPASVHQQEPVRAEEMYNPYAARQVHEVGREQMQHYDHPPSGYQVPIQQSNPGEPWMMESQYTRQQPAHQPGGQDLLASLSQNPPYIEAMRQMALQREQQHYGPPPPPQWQPPAQYSQTPYGGAEHRYGQPLYSMPQQPQVQQYAQPAAPAYRAQPQQPGANGRVIYVDEYGRRVELIPID